MWRGLREVRSHVSVSGKATSAGKTEAQERLAGQADPFNPPDGRPFALEVLPLAISSRLKGRFRPERAVAHARPLTGTRKP